MDSSRPSVYPRPRRRHSRRTCASSSPAAPRGRSAGPPGSAPGCAASCSQAHSEMRTMFNLEGSGSGPLLSLDWIASTTRRSEDGGREGSFGARVQGPAGRPFVPDKTGRLSGRSDDPPVIGQNPVNRDVVTGLARRARRARRERMIRRIRH